VERRRPRVDDHRAVDVSRRHLADRLRRLASEILQGRDGNAKGRGHVELAGEKRQIARRYFFYDRVLDGVEIRPIFFPVIGISRQLDPLVRLEFDEFEGTSADRMAAHVARRNMAGVDRRPSGSQQRDERGLRPPQIEGNLAKVFRQKTMLVSTSLRRAYAGDAIPDLDGDA